MLDLETFVELNTESALLGWITGKLGAARAAPSPRALAIAAIGLLMNLGLIVWVWTDLGQLVAHATQLLLLPEGGTLLAVATGVLGLVLLLGGVLLFASLVGFPFAYLLMTSGLQGAGGGRVMLTGSGATSWLRGPDEPAPRRERAASEQPALGSVRWLPVLLGANLLAALMLKVMGWGG